MQHDHYMKFAIQLAKEGMQQDLGGPFGAVVVKDGVIIGSGSNQVTSHNDPTAHAEMVAIRAACSTLGHFQLTGCVLYTSCEPCPMCLGAIYWARPDQFFYACSREDAAAFQFDDAFIYQEIVLSPNKRKIKAQQILQQEGITVFKEWQNKPNKIQY